MYGQEKVCFGGKFHCSTHCFLCSLVLEHLTTLWKAMELNPVRDYDFLFITRSHSTHLALTHVTYNPLSKSPLLSGVSDCYIEEGMGLHLNITSFDVILMQLKK